MCEWISVTMVREFLARSPPATNSGGRTSCRLAGVGGKIIFNLAFEFGQRLRERIFEDDENLARRGVGSASFKVEIVRRENVFGEEDAQLPADLDGALNHGHDSNLESWTGIFEFYFENWQDVRRVALMLRERACLAIISRSLVGGNSHAVERAIDKDQRDEEEKRADDPDA